MHRKNNFDFLRLLLASFVIITHAYPLSGLPECDWLCQVSGGQALLSKVGVEGFFVLSGYLIYQSLSRSANVLDYFWKRSLRIFPALLLVLTLTVVLAPFVYQGAVPYWQQRSVWTYVPNNIIMYRTQFGIQGVFEHNPFKTVINGSLWTIRYEFTMYILLALLLPLRRYKQRMKLGLFCLLGLLIAGHFIAPDWISSTSTLNQSLYELGGLFVAGALLASFEIEQIKYKQFVLIVCFLLLGVSMCLNIYKPVHYVLLPVVIILFGHGATPIIREVGARLGDLSYGVYIYAFPVQQAVVYFFKPSYLGVISWGIGCSYILAFLSWHLVEKRVLKLKRFRPTWPQQFRVLTKPAALSKLEPVVDRIPA